MSNTIVPSTTFTMPVVTFHGWDEETEVTVPASAATQEGFRDWAKSDLFPERGKLSFIEGKVVVDMSPENFESHSSLKAAVSSEMFFLIQRHNLGLFFPDGYLLSNEAAQLSTEPDAMFLSRESLRAGKAQLTESKQSPNTHVELVGSPDWVLEIVSPSSLRKDKEVLRKAYFRAGISEYWIIDARGDEIDFMMLARGPRGFVEVKQVDDWRLSPTFGSEFQITRQRDEDGFWQYTLQTKGNT